MLIEQNAFVGKDVKKCLLSLKSVSFSLTIEKLTGKAI